MSWAITGALPEAQGMAMADKGGENVSTGCERMLSGFVTCIFRCTKNFPCRQFHHKTLELHVGIKSILTSYKVLKGYCEGLYIHFPAVKFLS